MNKKASITGTVGLMVIIMLSINMGLALTQAGVNSLNPVGEVFFNSSTSPYNDYITNGDILTGDSAINGDDLPEDLEIEGDTTGNIITDTYNNAKTWFKQKLSKFSFISNMFGQPKGFLVDIGVPNSIALGIQVLWSMLFLIFLTAFMLGRT